MYLWINIHIYTYMCVCVIMHINVSHNITHYIQGEIILKHFLIVIILLTFITSTLMKNDSSLFENLGFYFCFHVLLDYGVRLCFKFVYIYTHTYIYICISWYAPQSKVM